MAVSNHSLGRWGSIKSDGWILRNEDGVAALRADNLPAGLKLFRNQIAMLKKAGCKRIFEETATGDRWERPELQACLNHLREGDVLVVWKLDRLSRSLSDLLRILEKVDKAGASFKSLTESLDTTGACGRLMMNMLGAFNQLEREIIKERTRLIVRNLRSLEQVIGVTVLDPIRDERGWAFRDGPGYSTDPVNGFAFLSEAYAATDPAFDGRVTVPVLWDKETRMIVNNSENDICRMFNDVFAAFGKREVDFFPKDIEAEHAELASFIYETVNNGVYKSGFATSQQAYERACRTLFAALDELDVRLSTRRYLFGHRIAEADWRLFCTLIRFDAVYHGHFKCNIRRILDYHNLQGYLLDLYQQPGIAETVNFDHIKRHYYFTHDDINPTRIVPIGPALDLTLPHGRERLGK